MKRIERICSATSPASAHESRHRGQQGEDPLIADPRGKDPRRSAEKSALIRDGAVCWCGTFSLGSGRRVPPRAVLLLELEVRGHGAGDAGAFVGGGLAADLGGDADHQ